MSLVKKNQLGVTHFLLVVLFVCLLGLVAVVGLRVVNNSSSPSSSAPAATASTAPDKIQSAADLTAAQSALDSAQPPDPAQLDSDIQSLL